MNLTEMIRQAVELVPDVKQYLDDAALQAFKADVPNRTKHEKTLQKRIAKAQAELLTTILNQLGDPPRVDLVDWAIITPTLTSAIIPTLTDIYIEQATVQETVTGITVSWDLVNENAARWAQQYGATLIKGIEDTTVNGVRQAVSDYYTTGQTMGDLQTRLETWFSPERAERIAVTEVTNASMQGEVEVISQINAGAYGFVMVPYWHTSNDDKVCSICRPRNGKRQGDGWEEIKPAHPRCRCWVTYRAEKL